MKWGRERGRDWRERRNRKEERRIERGGEIGRGGERLRKEEGEGDFERGGGRGCRGPERKLQKAKYLQIFKKNDLGKRRTRNMQHMPSRVASSLASIIAQPARSGWAPRQPSQECDLKRQAGEVCEKKSRPFFSSFFSFLFDFDMMLAFGGAVFIVVDCY